MNSVITQILKNHRPELTERELNEIDLALFYKENLAHGTDGHSRLILIAKLAELLCTSELLYSQDGSK